ncbi:MAG: DUF3467 domain-containing protein [Candidatus Parcubacteria bacterium]|nr:DUF3467 domain-containing protein [Candidatus Parcubacteria bacterium]
MDQPNQGQQINIKAIDEILAGKYANMMQVAHTKEEFVLDFMNILPPQGILNARVITSPGHMKRIIKALQDNMEKYEQAFGPINEAEAPKGTPFPII